MVLVENCRGQKQNVGLTNSHTNSNHNFVTSRRGPKNVTKMRRTCEDSVAIGSTGVVTFFSHFFHIFTGGRQAGRPPGSPPTVGRPADPAHWICQPGRRPGSLKTSKKLENPVQNLCCVVKTLKSMCKSEMWHNRC